MMRTAQQEVSTLLARSCAFLALESPLAMPALHRLYWSIEPRLARLRYRSELAAYRIPLEPFRRCWIDPERLTRFSRRQPASVEGYQPPFGAVCGGDWDRRSYPTAPAVTAFGRCEFDTVSGSGVGEKTGAERKAGAEMRAGAEIAADFDTETGADIHADLDTDGNSNTNPTTQLDADATPDTVTDTDTSPATDLFDAPTLEELPLYRAIDACIVGNRDWTETEFVQTVLARLENGQYPVWKRCRTRADVLERCRYLEDLAVELTCEGFQTQVALARQRGGWSGRGRGARTQTRTQTQTRTRTRGRVQDTIHVSDRDGTGTKTGNRSPKPQHHHPSRLPQNYVSAFANEILVDVARDGELLIANGVHRLCIAAAIGLERIPVAILIRHRNWVDTCNRRWIQGKPLPAHPDLWGLEGATRRP